MKRLLVFLLVCSVAAGAAFAQVAFSGKAYAGIRLEKVDGEEDPKVSPEHRKEGTPVFELSSTVTKEDYGVKADVDYRPVGNTVTVQGVYGWAGFMENSLRLAVGKIKDPLWMANIDASLPEWKFDDVAGFRVDYKTPIDGLSVGMAMAVTADPNLRSFEDTFKTPVLGASYLSPLFASVFAFDFGNNKRALLGFNFLGDPSIPGLTAGIQVQATNLGTWNSFRTMGEVTVYEKAAYVIIRRKLEAQMILGQTFYGRPEFAGGRETRNVLEFTPGVSYNITPQMLAKFNFTVKSPDHFWSTDYILNPVFEYTLKGAAVLYAEYDFEIKTTLGDDRNRFNHKFGFGFDFKAF